MREISSNVKLKIVQQLHNAYVGMRGAGRPVLPPGTGLGPVLIAPNLPPGGTGAGRAGSPEFE